MPVQYEVVMSYTPCSGSNCINVAVGPPPPDQPTNCAETGPQSGTWFLTTRTASYTQSYMDFLINHELGHPLGLGDNACSLSNSIMKQGAAQCGDTMPSTAPRTSDAMAVAHTSYDPNGVTATCR